MAADRAPAPAGGGGYLLSGIRPLNPARIGPDVIAGITLAALGIPEVMGYTRIIGTPVITGLYTILLPVLAFAVFGSSRLLVVGADSATAAIVAAGLAALSIPPGEHYLAMCSLVALVAAGMLALARLFRLGFLADFLSSTVLAGFLTGVGIQVAASELPGVLGIAKGGHGFFGQLAHTASHVSEADPRTMGIAFGVLALIVACDRLAPRIPGALIAVVGLIAASAAFGWSEKGIAVVGAVPGGLPRLALPAATGAEAMSLLPVAFSCFIVILAQSAATSRSFAQKYRDRFNENVDLVGLSMANLAAGASGTFVVNGSPTKTAMVDTAGGRSQVAHLTTATVVLLVLLFLTRPLSFLPDAVLSAIVFLIGVRLVEARALRDIYHKTPREFLLAAVTAATVVVVGVEQGILLAMVVSLIQVVRRTYQPHTAVILPDPVEQWRMVPAVPGEMLAPGLVMYWFGSQLYYANAAHFAEEARRLVEQSPTPVRWLGLDAGAVTHIDYSAARMLGELQEDLAGRGVTLVLARVDPELLAELERLQLTARIGREHLFASRAHCLDAYRALPPVGAGTTGR